MSELTYTRCGDYYIPDIQLQNPNIRLGKWGLMRKAYLRIAQPFLFSEMVLSETLRLLAVAFVVFIIPHIAEWLIIRIAVINYGLRDFIKS